MAPTSGWFPFFSDGATFPFGDPMHMKIPRDPYTLTAMKYVEEKNREDSEPGGFSHHEIQFLMMMQALNAISHNLKNVAQPVEDVRRELGTSSRR